MKKFLFMMVALLPMLCSFTACGDDDDKEDDPAPSSWVDKIAGTWGGAIYGSWFGNQYTFQKNGDFTANGSYGYKNVKGTYTVNEEVLQMNYTYFSLTLDDECSCTLFFEIQSLTAEKMVLRSKDHRDINTLYRVH